VADLVGDEVGNIRIVQSECLFRTARILKFTVKNDVSGRLIRESGRMTRAVGSFGQMFGPYSFWK
jgi:hypothetical protein